MLPRSRAIRGQSRCPGPTSTSRAAAPAGVGRGARDDATIAELRRLRDAAERDGLQLMLPALRAALAEAAAMAPVPVGSV